LPPLLRLPPNLLVPSPSLGDRMSLRQKVVSVVLRYSSFRSIPPFHTSCIQVAPGFVFWLSTLPCPRQSFTPWFPSDTVFFASKAVASDFKSHFPTLDLIPFSETGYFPSSFLGTRIFPHGGSNNFPPFYMGVPLSVWLFFNGILDVIDIIFDQPDCTLPQLLLSAGQGIPPPSLCQSLDPPRDLRSLS